jgi:diguanylate cyclase (GGDEF)-like protein
MKVTQFFEQQGKIFLGILGVLLAVLLGVVDYLTGYEINLSLFYLIPISLAAWYAGQETGLVVSGVSAITWFLADIFSGAVYSNSWIYLWNTLIRLGFFAIVTFLLVALKKAFQTNQELARTDYITGAVSIRFFYELAQRELGRSKRYNHPFTFAYFDLDNFKEINDRFGHTAGDKVLQAVTDGVQKKIRNIDIFARLGGDEFALLMPETGEVEAQSVISRVRRSLLEEMQKNNWGITFSIGVVTFIKIPKTVDDMVKMADDVMYPIKTGGKNGVSYTIYEG